MQVWSTAHEYFTCNHIVFPLTFKIVLACGGNGRGRGIVGRIGRRSPVLAAATRKVATTNFAFHSISLASGMPEKQFESMRLFASVSVCGCVFACVQEVILDSAAFGGSFSCRSPRFLLAPLLSLIVDAVFSLTEFRLPELWEIYAAVWGIAVARAN